MSSFDAGAILRETRDYIREAVPGEYKSLQLERVVFGLFFTGVKLNNGDGGICFTPVKAIPEAVCCPSSAKVMPLSGRLKGMEADRVLREMEEGNPLKKALGIATLNALSLTLERSQGTPDFEVILEKDALDLLTLHEEEFVVVVGALAPYLKRLKARGKPFRVLEMDPRTLKKDEMPFYSPAEEAPLYVPKADLLVVTGTSLVNDTLEGLLALARKDARVVVLGPTASQYPRAFFERGVDMLGGIRVTAPDDLLDLLAEAGSGYHFFGRSAERTTIVPRRNS
ncbi:MAG TPA: DUF364 domain-containing protein [Synergistaceae bacterium]|nr:DUF364 domain-containing protein [Synergistaceae bacterium]